jgi:hypothetical protein
MAPQMLGYQGRLNSAQEVVETLFAHKAAGLLGNAYNRAQISNSTGSNDAKLRRLFCGI